MARVPLIDTTNPGCSRCGGHEFERMRVETYHDTAGYFHLSIYWQCRILIKRCFLKYCHKIMYLIVK